jgi:hypothetical protein
MPCVLLLLLATLAVPIARAQVVGLAVNGSQVRSGVAAAVHGSTGSAGFTLGGSASVGWRRIEVTGSLAKSYRDEGLTSNATSRGVTVRLRLLDGRAGPVDLTLLGGVGRSAFSQDCIFAGCTYTSHWYPIGVSVGGRMGREQLLRPWVAPRLDLHRMDTHTVSQEVVPSEHHADFGLSTGFDLDLPVRVSFAFDMRRRGDLPSRGGTGPRDDLRTAVTVSLHLRAGRGR